MTDHLHRLSPQITVYGRSTPVVGSMTPEAARAELRRMAVSLVGPTGKAVGGYLKLTSADGNRHIEVNHSGGGATAAANLVRALVERGYGKQALGPLDAYLQTDKGLIQSSRKIGSLSFLKLLTTLDPQAVKDHAQLGQVKLSKARIQPFAVAPRGVKPAPQPGAPSAPPSASASGGASASSASSGSGGPSNSAGSSGSGVAHADAVLRPQPRSIDEVREALQARTDKAMLEQDTGGDIADAMAQRLENISLLNEAFDQHYPVAQRPESGASAGGVSQASAQAPNPVPAASEADRAGQPWSREEFDHYWSQLGNVFQPTDARSWLVTNSGVRHQYGLVQSASAERELDALYQHFKSMPRSEAVKRLAEFEEMMVLQAANQNPVSAVNAQAAPASAAWADRLLGQLGLSRHLVPPDGHCLFSALAHAEGGEARQAFIQTPIRAAQIQRQRLLNQLELTTAEQAARMAGKAMPPGLSDEARGSQLCDSFVRLSIGLDAEIKTGRGHLGWGGQFEIRLKAIELQKTLAVVTPQGVDVLYPDGSSETVALDQVERLKGLKASGVPFLLNELGSHFDSTEAVV